MKNYKVVNRLEHNGIPVSKPFNAGVVQAKTETQAKRIAVGKATSYNKQQFKRNSEYKTKVFKVEKVK